ncbi:MAG: Gfo/Idh/MocA family oxidoreductase [Planctomycetota bacterium]|nr:Gfo/Idh/MocA family oxidoreductase [Planctomycetota bacterium]MDA1142227.1 Gfo/Idh/MocA family oxidoreductase [Planctomycetota bacterium]
MPKLKIAMVGCGGLPNGNLLPAIQLIDELDLVATCDLREDAARKTAEKYGAPRFYTDHLKLFDEEDLDGIVVAAPPEVHALIGTEALNRGLHLFTEKPPAMTTARAKEFRDAAKGKSLKVLVGTVQRHCPVNQMAKEIMGRESFGTPMAYQARYICPGPGMRMDWGMNRNSDDDMFRFFFLDHIIHHIDVCRFFMGDIISVSAFRSQLEGELYAATINYRFASGATGNQVIAFRSPAFENRCLIVGSGPAWVETQNWTKLEYSCPGLPVGKGSYFDSPVIKWDGGISYQGGVFRPGYREELTTWARAILDNTDCAANLEDGYRAMLIIDAIIESTKGAGEVVIRPEG